MHKNTVFPREHVTVQTNQNSTNKQCADANPYTVCNVTNQNSTNKQCADANPYTVGNVTKII